MRDKTLLIPVDEFASPIELFASEEMSVKDVKEHMVKNGYRHVPVLKNNIPVGIITSRDISLINSLKYQSDFLVSEVMVQDPYCVLTGTSLEEVAYEMSSRKIGSAIVVNDRGEAESIFTSVDGLNAIIEIIRGEI